jgi:hypothetical protein
MAVGLAVSLGGCALSGELPPLTQNLLSPAGARAGLDVTPFAPSSDRSTAAIEREFNSAEDLSRVSVTTHGGAYFLWVQRPRVTFFFVHTGRELAEPPGTVYLVFRTQSPQGVANNHLELTCDGSSEFTPGLPTSRVVPGAFTSSHYLTFPLDPRVFLRFAQCGSGTVEVGGVRASFSPKHLAKLQALAGQMRPRP